MVRTNTVHHADSQLVPPQQPLEQTNTLASGGPRRLAEGVRTVADLIEQEPALWPALTTCVGDTEGRSIVHYAAAQGSSEAAQLFDLDGVLPTWRSHLDQAHETRREREKGRECVVTLTGRRGDRPVTVLFTVLLGTEPVRASEQEET